jgi:hypothetical protein
VTQTGNRCSYDRRGIPPAQDHAPDTNVRYRAVNDCTKEHDLRAAAATRQTAYKSNDSYKGPPEVCGAKSHRASARHRIRESRQKSK